MKLYSRGLICSLASQPSKSSYPVKAEEEKKPGKDEVGRRKRREGRTWTVPGSDSPGLFSIFRPRLPHSRTFDINIRICFWQSDLLLFGHGLRLLAICRLAWGSLTSLRWRIRELARAAIFPAPTLPRPHRRSPGVGGYRGPPPCPLTQGDGAPQRGSGAERIGRLSRGPTGRAARKRQVGRTRGGTTPAAKN